MLLKSKINSGELVITKFFPYTSSTQLRLYECEKSCYEEKDKILSISEIRLKWLYELWMRVNGLLDKSLRDNKTVLEFHLKDYPDQTLYVGNYDGKISLGLDLYCHSTYRAEPIPLNIYIK